MRLDVHTVLNTHGIRATICSLYCLLYSFKVWHVTEYRRNLTDNLSCCSTTRNENTIHRHTHNLCTALRIFNTLVGALNKTTTLKTRPDNLFNVWYARRFGNPPSNCFLGQPKVTTTVATKLGFTAHVAKGCFLVTQVN